MSDSKEVSSDVDGDSCPSRCYLAFVVGEWFAKTIRHLDRQAFDSRELGRAILSLSAEGCSLPPTHKDMVDRIRAAGVQACQEYKFGPEVITNARAALVEESSR
jgi:hypothetical protein